MPDTVIPIGLHVVVPGAESHPVPEIIAILKQSLIEAERGELQGFAMFAVTGGGNITMRWHPGGSAGGMLGGSTLLHESIKDAFIDNALSNCQDELPPVG